MNASVAQITAKIDAETRDLLSRAAALAGLPGINAFVVSAAVEKANLLMEQEHALKLSQTDAARLVECLDRPTQANAELKKAAARYAETQA